MANYNYFEAVKADVEQWIQDNMDLENDIITGEFADRDEIEDYLNDRLWTEDSVTGNASGSYTFNREEAKKYVFEDPDAVFEALKEFCTDSDTIADKFLSEDWEYFDVTARCYLLGQVISEVLDELEDDIEDAIAEREAAEEITA